MSYACPVCYLEGLEEDPKQPTYEICPQCGTEFGADDEDATHAQLRTAWIRGGRKYWFREGVGL